MQTLVREPKDKADACVIWLHGLGADGHDFESIVDALELTPGHAIRFIFPHAPYRPVTINNGMVMRAWYDIYDIDKEMPEDEAGINESHQMLKTMIAAQVAAGIPTERIVLAGFSQGGCIALHTGLRYPQKLAGVLGLSTYLPLRRRLPEELAVCQKETPIMLMHGIHDPVVSYEFGRLSYQALSALGLKTQWREYSMEHTVSHPQLADIGQFINTCL